jgi:hypothetical protein
MCVVVGEGEEKIPIFFDTKQKKKKKKKKNK